MSVNKSAVILAAVMLLSLPMASAESNQLDRGPGLVGAGSPIYGLEVAMDNAAMNLRLAKAGEVAKERAAEAEKAAENNNSRAAARAGKQLGKVAEKAPEGESEDIQAAMSSFQQTMNRMEERIQNAPNDQARQGMQTALENMRGAFENMQEAQQNREESKKQGENQDGPENAPQQGSNSSDSGSADDQQSGSNTGINRQQTQDRNTSDNEPAPSSPGAP